LFRYYVYVYFACKGHSRNDLYCVLTVVLQPLSYFSHGSCVSDCRCRKKQEIWANAHKTRKSLSQFLFANCQSVFSHFIAVHRKYQKTSLEFLNYLT